MNQNITVSKAVLNELIDLRVFKAETKVIENIQNLLKSSTAKALQVEGKLGQIQKQVNLLNDQILPLNNDVYYLMNKYKEIDRIGQHFKQLEKKVEQV